MYCRNQDSLMGSPTSMHAREIKALFHGIQPLRRRERLGASLPRLGVLLILLSNRPQRIEVTERVECVARGQHGPCGEEQQMIEWSQVLAI